MKAMKTPGFTAESSIYIALERYEMNRDLHDAAEHRGVLPQFRPVQGVISRDRMCRRGFKICTPVDNEVGYTCWCI